MENDSSRIQQNKSGELCSTIEKAQPVILLYNHDFGLFVCSLMLIFILYTLLYRAMRCESLLRMVYDITM